MAIRQSKPQPQRLSLRSLLDTMHTEKASDLILTIGAPPMLKVGKTLKAIGKELLTPESVTELIHAVLNPKQKEIFNSGRELDFSFGIKSLARFRANAFVQRGAPGAVFRIIPFEIPVWAEISGPKNILPLIDRLSGLVIVTGPAASGKSVIMASLIDYISSRHGCHIITIEDPIEMLFRHKKSVVTQRQVGADTESFETGLRYVLRQSPDVVMIGELDNLEMVNAAVTLAESGLLCIVPLYAPNAINAIERMVKIFPAESREFVRSRLADCLLFVMASRLFPAKTGQDKTIAYEVLVNDEKVRRLIRLGELFKLRTHLNPSLQTSIQKLKRQGKVA